MSLLSRLSQEIFQDTQTKVSMVSQSPQGISTLQGSNKQTSNEGDLGKIIEENQQEQEKEDVFAILKE